MLEINDGKNYLNVFENITELATYVTSRPRKAGRDNSSETGDFGFCGTHNFAEAVDLLKYGDEETFQEVKKEKNKIKIEKIIGNATKRQTYENRVYGCIPNVPSFLIGNPINMINPEKNRPSQKIVNIFLNIRIGGWASKESTIENGTKYLSVIDILEKKGYRCNLYAGTANEKDGKHCYMLVKVKTDREPLNIKKICFAIANPSMQRRIKFKWMEVNDFPHDFTYGYGQPDKREYTSQILKEKLKEDFVIWTYEDSDGNANIEEVIANLEKYGIRIEGAC